MRRAAGVHGRLAMARSGCETENRPPGDWVWVDEARRSSDRSEDQRAGWLAADRCLTGTCIHEAAAWRDPGSDGSRMPPGPDRGSDGGGTTSDYGRSATCTRRGRPLTRKRVPAGAGRVLGAVPAIRATATAA